MNPRGNDKNWTRRMTMVKTKFKKTTLSISQDWTFRGHFYINEYAFNRNRCGTVARG